MRQRGAPRTLRTAVFATRLGGARCTSKTKRSRLGRKSSALVSMQKSLLQHSGWVYSQTHKIRNSSVGVSSSQLKVQIKSDPKTTSLASSSHSHQGCQGCQEPTATMDMIMVAGGYDMVQKIYSPQLPALPFYLRRCPPTGSGSPPSRRTRSAEFDPAVSALRRSRARSASAESGWIHPVVVWGGWNWVLLLGMELNSVEYIDPPSIP